MSVLFVIGLEALTAGDEVEISFAQETAGARITNTPKMMETPETDEAAYAELETI